MKLRVVSQEDISPGLSLASDRFFLQTVDTTAVLRVYTCPGDTLLLGRYHAAAGLNATDRVTVSRRLSGGRVVPSGHGFVHFSLILPHRSAFFSDDPFYLAPFQVLNRHVRSVLHGFKAAGVQLFYPGRDFLTIDRRTVGWVSWTSEKNGAVLIEGSLAVRRDFSLLPYLLDTIDPDGTISSQFLAPDQVTSLEQVAGRPPSLAQLTRLFQHGFAQLAETCVVQDLTHAEQEHIAGLAHSAEAAAWLSSWPARHDLPFQPSLPTPLGSLTIGFDVTPQQTLAALQLSGDFLAPVHTVERLQSALSGQPLAIPALQHSMDQIFLSPEHYFLGPQHVRVIPETILHAYGL